MQSPTPEQPCFWNCSHLQLRDAAASSSCLPAALAITSTCLFSSFEPAITHLALCCMRHVPAMLCCRCHTEPYQAVGASGAAALRPALHKAASKGVTSVKRVTLESAEQSKKSLCLALLREVSWQTAFHAGSIPSPVSHRPNNHKQQHSHKMKHTQDPRPTTRNIMQCKPIGPASTRSTNLTSCPCFVLHTLPHRLP